MAITYYGDKIRYNGTLIQSGGGSSYPIVSLGTRLGDNGFKVSGSSGFIRKVETSTITTGGYTTVWKSVGDRTTPTLYRGGGIKPNNYCRSYRVIVNGIVKITSTTAKWPYIGVAFNGWYNCDGYSSSQKATFSVLDSSQTLTITDSYADQDDDWEIGVIAVGGTNMILDIYYLNITMFYGANQTGASGVLYSVGSPYVAPTNQTITNTYYV